MHKLISKSTGLMAIFAALVMTPVVSQSAIAQAVPSQGAESIGDGAIAHNGHIHRRKKDKPATGNSLVVMPAPAGELVY